MAPAGEPKSFIMVNKPLPAASLARGTALIISFISAGVFMPLAKPISTTMPAIIHSGVLSRMVLIVSMPSSMATIDATTIRRQSYLSARRPAMGAEIIEQPYTHMLMKPTWEALPPGRSLMKKASE
ncbi:hypothetical protein D3C78_1652900 [compost metagenome]